MTTKEYPLTGTTSRLRIGTTVEYAHSIDEGRLVDQQYRGEGLRARSGCCIGGGFHRHRIRAHLFLAAAIVIGSLPLSLPAAAADGLEALAHPGRVLMLRHANAPGYGDPPGFRLGDCRTQRNLDEKGRAQARATGDRLRALGIRKARVYSSQWCRALETARLLGVGEVEELPGLNSFFEGHVERESTLAALRDFLARQPVDGPPLILVTHQVVINAFAQEVPASGGGSVFALDPNEKDWLRWITATQPVR